jgi:hypothetical protein
MSPRISGLYNSENDGGPAAFSYLAQKAGSSARGPDLWPKTQKWVPTFQSGPPSCPPKLVRTQTHTQIQYTRGPCGWNETPNRNVIADEASRSREKPAQNMGPLWREIKLLCVVYATGKVQESVAPPSPSPQIVFIPLYFPSIAPECRPTIKCLREVMKSRSGFFQRALCVTWRRVVL